MIGLACVWAARREGADVVYAGDVDASRVELACSLAPGGAVVGFDAGGEALHDRLVRQGVPLPDRCVDAVGLAATCRDALRAVRVGGVVSIVGMAAPVVELDMYEVTTNEKTLVGSFCYSAATFEECAEAVAAGEVDAALFVDSVIGLDDAPQTFAELAAHTRSSVKTIVLPHR
jgi:threonine dehydrogenase-like Zn-dependent dehydrogenase